MKDIKFASKVAHAITVVALHDPDDLWDVQIFTKQATDRRSRHVIALPPPDIFLTAKGLEHVGPRAFGYDLDFRSVFST